MPTARLVPVTTEMDGDDLAADEAWKAARRVGLRRLLVASYVRFRYADGYSNARALALQAALAVVPFVLALSGLTMDLDAPKVARVVAKTIDAISPGGSQDALSTAIHGGQVGHRTGEIALVLGLAFSIFSMTLAMGQLERSANRIYGIERDRPLVTKYVRALVLTLLLGAPVGIGFLVLVAGGAFADAMTQAHAWSTGLAHWWAILRWPGGVVLLAFTIAVVLDRSPRRRQPGLSWLALGSGVSVLLCLVVTGALASYVHISSSFDAIYGPLAGVVALLLWGLGTSVALLLGISVAAQLEAFRSGQEDPVIDDPGRPGRQRVRD